MVATTALNLLVLLLRQASPLAYVKIKLYVNGFDSLINTPPDLFLITLAMTFKQPTAAPIAEFVTFGKVLLFSSAPILKHTNAFGRRMASVHGCYWLREKVTYRLI